MPILHIIVLEVSLKFGKETRALVRFGSGRYGLQVTAVITALTESTRA
jgi:hypothetical protein